MINTKELMIGNWVLSNQRAREVENIHEDCINLSYSCGDYEGGSGSDYYEEVEDVEPIPLTEQILVDCGFKKSFYDVWSKDGIGVVYYNGDFWLQVYQYNESIQEHEYNEILEANTPPIESLHRLQNLFYLLTGKQLEIKL